MIEVRESGNIKEQVDALVELVEIRTRITLLMEYIYEQEIKAARDALEYPKGYNTDIDKVEIPVGKVLWLLGFQHDDTAAKMFKEAREEFKKAREEEKAEKENEKNG